MGAKAEKLAKRNELLEELWQIDEWLRRYHASHVFQHGSEPYPQDPELIQKRERRDRLMDDIRELGGDPWHFDPFIDKSWLVVQRQRVCSDQATA
jgi:hypothetical protein